MSPDHRSGRLAPEDYAAAFADAVPPMTRSEALLEAERCLYCFDAPCATACPTGIDVPAFIRRIADGNLRGAARAILEANPLGGTCARACPTETLCEQACVRTAQEARPVAIGRLQRHAVDALFASDRPQLFSRAPATGKRVAVVGAGPAGLACAHGLARMGHEVVLLERQPKLGGLDEYGLAAYKMAGDFAQREVAWLLSIGGIEPRAGFSLERVAQLQALRDEYDAVFLGLGLTGTHALGIPGEALAGVADAVDFIATLRQSDPARVPVGRQVVVIGGGMTAVDASVQSRLLGAERVSMVYRRGPEQLSASRDEQEWAQTRGVSILHWMAPVEILGDDAGRVRAVRFARQALVDGRPAPTGETETIEADMVLKAIGQRFGGAMLAEAGIAMRDGRIDPQDESGRTTLPGVWAGGDCLAGGLDLTVEAVEHGKRAARAIHAHLTGGAAG